jgi:hypothetical protein
VARTERKGKTSIYSFELVHNGGRKIIQEKFDTVA